MRSLGMFVLLSLSAILASVESLPTVTRRLENDAAASLNLTTEDPNSIHQSSSSPQKQNPSETETLLVFKPLDDYQRDHTIMRRERYTIRSVSEAPDLDENENETSLISSEIREENVSELGEKQQKAALVSSEMREDNLSELGEKQQKAALISSEIGDNIRRYIPKIEIPPRTTSNVRTFSNPGIFNGDMWPQFRRQIPFDFVGLPRYMYNLLQPISPFPRSNEISPIDYSLKIKPLEISKLARGRNALKYPDDQELYPQSVFTRELDVPFFSL